METRHFGSSRGDWNHEISGRQTDGQKI